jgi:hypothetical protein
MNQMAQQVRIAQANLQQAMRQQAASLAVGQRAQAPASVGQCGPTPWNCSPNLPPLPMQANQLLTRDCAPLGIRVQASTAGALTTATIAPSAGAYYIFGVRSFNGEDEITIQTIRTAGSTVAMNAGPFDAAAYNTIDCWCGVDWGCITTTTPLTIQFNSVGSPSTPPFLNWVLFGRFVQGWNTCYVGIPSPFGGSAVPPAF